MSDNPAKLPPRGTSDHKGNSGRVLILAGSRPYFGAAALSLMGAARGGAGYVFGAVPASIVGRLTPSLPSVLITGLRETHTGHLSTTALGVILDLLVQSDALVLGPGWGQREGLAFLLGEILRRAEVPVVIDADALNLLADHPGILADRDRFILTPHPGEAARLLGTTPSQVESDRPRALSQLIEQIGGVVVLKGAGTLVGEGGKVYRNDTGNPAMAVAGMGDVLAGLIGALLAQGSSPYDAACQAVWAHGYAGDLAAAQNGPRGVLPSEVAHYLPLALSELQS